LTELLIVKKVLIIHKLYYFSETKNIITAFAKQPGLIMKKKISFRCGFLLLFLWSAATADVLGQEVGSPSFEAYDRLSSETNLFSDEGDSTDVTPGAKRDSAAVRMTSPKRNVYKPAPVVPKQKDESTDPDDNSVLSFNFLYYLIQKYKMQDIVD
jgi:hypothetical protein